MLDSSLLEVEQSQGEFSEILRLCFYPWLLFSDFHSYLIWWMVMTLVLVYLFILFLSISVQRQKSFCLSQAQIADILSMVRGFWFVEILKGTYAPTVIIRFDSIWSRGVVELIQIT